MARTLELDTITEPGNSGTANITLSSNTTTTMPLVDINGGAIDGTTVGAGTPSSVAATTLTASGATTLNGNVTLGNASGDTVTVTGTMAGFDNKSGMTGEIRMWGGSSAPTGWLLCNGANYDGGSVTYAALYAIIGQNFGVGDSTANDFNVPDMEGRVPVGVGTGAGDGAEDTDGSTVPAGTALTARSLGEWTGTETIGLLAHTHTMKNHTHTWSATSGTPSNNTTAGPNETNTGAPSNNTSGTPSDNTTSTTGSHVHTLTQGLSDGSEENHGLGAAWGGAGTTDSSQHVNSNGNHEHTLENHTHTLSSHVHSLQVHTHTMQNHTHTVSGTTAAPNDNTSDSTGSTTKHTIPIMCVNFIIKT